MYWALIVLHVVVCTFLVLVVLLQAGKGGGVGIAFGGGGSQTVFGSSGAGNFLTKLTAICATIFFLNSLGLAYLSSASDSNRLKALSEKQAASKQAEQAAKNKVLGDVEKARKQLESGGAPASSAPASSSPASSAPASAPASSPPAPAPPASSPPPATGTPAGSAAPPAPPPAPPAPPAPAPTP